MKRFSLFVAAMLAGTVCAFAAAPRMKVVTFTGEVQVKVGDQVTTLKAGETIPAGAEVIVKSGDAVLQAGNTVVSAKAGDSFSFNIGSDNSVKLAATGNTSALSVQVGKSVAVLKAGDAISVTGGKKGGVIAVTAGTVSVSVAGAPAQSVGAGESVSAAPPAKTAEPAPESAPTAQSKPDTNPPPPSIQQNQAAVSPSTP